MAAASLDRHRLLAIALRQQRNQDNDGYRYAQEK